MLIRRRAPLLRAAVVGGTAYAAGHHMATKSAQKQQMEAQQNAQIAEMQQQARQPASPQSPPAPAPSHGLTDEGIAQLKQLGALHESGVLTDAEFEAAKKKILGIS